MARDVFIIILPWDTELEYVGRPNEYLPEREQVDTVSLWHERCWLANYLSHFVRFNGLAIVGNQGR